MTHTRAHSEIGNGEIELYKKNPHTPVTCNFLRHGSGLFKLNDYENKAIITMFWSCSGNLFSLNVNRPFIRAFTLKPVLTVSMPLANRTRGIFVGIYVRIEARCCMNRNDQQCKCKVEKICINRDDQFWELFTSCCWACEVIELWSSCSSSVRWVAPFTLKWFKHPRMMGR